MDEKRVLQPKKKLALIAHDNKKRELIEWINHNKETLSEHQLYGTGTTGKMIEEQTALHVNKLKSGPMGGDLQIGGLIASGDIDAVFFFWDPMQAQPHDPDIRALLRICAVWNIPIANNRSTADFIITSPLFRKEYEVKLTDYASHMERNIPE